MAGVMEENVDGALLSTQLAKQYDHFADTFSTLAEEGNIESRAKFYESLNPVKVGCKMLDIGCGDGSDCEYYQSLGVEIHGLDASEEFVRKATSRLTGFDIQVGIFENIPFADETFDYIVSKYAIQTSANMQTCFSEVHRCLKPGGIFQFLVTHPFRQYLEKRDISASYFEQRVVVSNFFGTCTVQEPSHTMNEYLNEWMLTRFTLISFSEHWDKHAEQVDGRVYPGYFIMKFSKRA